MSENMTDQKTGTRCHVARCSGLWPSARLSRFRRWTGDGNNARLTKEGKLRWFDGSRWPCTSLARVEKEGNRFHWWFLSHRIVCAQIQVFSILSQATHMYISANKRKNKSSRWYYHTWTSLSFFCYASVHVCNIKIMCIVGFLHPLKYIYTYIYNWKKIQPRLKCLNFLPVISYTHC